MTACYTAKVLLLAFNEFSIYRLVSVRPCLNETISFSPKNGFLFWGIKPPSVLRK